MRRGRRLLSSCALPKECPERAARRDLMSVEVRKAREAAKADAMVRRGAYAERVAGVRICSDLERPIRFAVVGGGRMGEIRCEHVARNAGARLAAFVDVRPASAARLASRHPGCEAFVKLEDALEALHVDAVWICSPTPSHSSLVAAAAERGAHVAVEKPVAMTVPEIRAAYAVCHEHGVHLSCAFQRRSDAAYSAVSDAVANGDVGDPRSIRAVFRDHPAPPPAFLADAGGDPFHDLATHDLDFILDLVKRRVATRDDDDDGGGAHEQRPRQRQPLDDDVLTHHQWFRDEGYRRAVAVDKYHPDEVYAFGTSSTADLRDKGVFDAATVVLKWKKPALDIGATLDIARGSTYGYDQRLEVFGTTGAAVSVENAPDANFKSANHRGVNVGKLVHSFPQRFDHAFATELDHFLDCVRGHGAPKVTSNDAVLATTVAEAAKISAERELPVKLTTNHRGDVLILDP